jgi:D-alanyl-D-alanine dipeptidase/CHAT domain-containing protein/Tfp pilus assembly protein PilF
MHLAVGALALVVLLGGIAAAKDTSSGSSALPSGFVYLRDVDPTIEQDIRYATQRNFTGRRVPGYEAGECILLRAAARALKQVQADLRPQGFTLKVYDCYRPTRAVRAFLAWAKADASSPQSQRYYPRVERGKLVAQGYIAAVSAHSLGIAVDVTLVPLANPGAPAFNPQADYGPCTAPKAGREPDDGVDAGTGFDCFDPISHTGSAEITAEQRANRTLLIKVLTPRGFDNYVGEWWHFRYLRAAGSLQPRDFVIRPHVALAAPPESAALERRVTELADAGRYKEALQRAEALRSATERRFGKASTAYANSLCIHARLLGVLDRYEEAAGAYREALAVRRSLLGADDLSVAEVLASLAAIEAARGQYADAEELYSRAQAIREKVEGPEHSDVAAVLNGLGLLYYAEARFDEARDVFSRVLAIREKAFGMHDLAVADTLNRLGLVHDMMDEYDAAEASYRRAHAIREARLGSEHPDVAQVLNNLGAVYRIQRRDAEAEQVLLRALAIRERAFGREHADVAIVLNNLALLRLNQGRLDEAEADAERARAIREKALGRMHREYAKGLHTLAAIHLARGRLADAEELLKSAIAIRETLLGKDHTDVAKGLDALAVVVQRAGRPQQAREYVERALQIRRAKLGAKHPEVADSLATLARLHLSQQEWRLAHARFSEAADITTQRSLYGAAEALSSRERTRSEASRKAYMFIGLVEAAFRLAAEDAAGADRLRDEAFRMAQWAAGSKVEAALGLMAARFGSGDSARAALIRRRQDRVHEWHVVDRRMVEAAARPAERRDLRKEAMQVARLGRLEKEIDEIDRRVAGEFPDYAALANPKPLSIAVVQGLLRDREAVVQFLVGEEQSFAWLVTRSDSRWLRIPLGRREISEQVQTLRCGLDLSSWSSTSEWPSDSELDRARIREQRARRERCKELLKVDISPKEWPPFDLDTAHRLYEALLAPFAAPISGKHLLVVPSAALSSLPFHVLVTAKPEAALKGAARYRSAAWLALQQPVTVLPSVGSLQALRRLGPSRAAEPYIGFGNPLLLGASGTDRSAFENQHCRDLMAGSSEHGALGRGRVSLRAIDLAQLRAQPPLPETARELCAVAAAVTSLERESDTVWLGERATERNLKRLSREGKLARYRVVHFATHGLLSGESEALNGAPEPSLVLTPPRDGTSPAELQEDDGLLTASEVAQLDLDADWVVLSACNTAAGEKGDAEALSGLARAFFYAKARALLVSHWYVSSGASVKLTTRAFSELKADAGIGRSEALRRSMVALISNGQPEESHPAVWAPFVVVGEGAR